MARYRGRSGSRHRGGGSGSRYSGNYDTYGRDRALEHIAAAHRLSEELGGTDKDVKAYFFALPPPLLVRILNEYEAQHGIRAREYAEATMPNWRTGRVTMSGLVAERLFSLLPPTMPIAAKYKLTEGLWRHVGPKSKKRLRVGIETPLDEVLESVRAHIDEVVLSYRVPPTLERRFNWLADGDVGIKQDLLNYLRQMEKGLVVEGARTQLPVMLDHLKSPASEQTHRLSQTLIVGNHHLEILLDRTFEGVALEEWSPAVRPRGATGSGSGVFWFWVIAAIVVAYLVFR